MPNNTKNKNLPFKIGADPEFLFFYGNKAIHAQNILTYLNKNSTLEKIDMGFQINMHGSVGWDGHSSTGEIRPTADTNPYVVTENIRAIIKATHTMGPFLDMSVLSLGSQIGGHIHVDITDQVNENTGQTLYNDTKHMNKIRKLVATYLIPILASDHKICAANRTLNGNYGQQDDIRISRPNGNNKITTTIEIRGPSAEWMTTPRLAAATLAYIGVIWHEIRNNHAALIKMDTTIKNKMQISSLQQLVLSEYKPLMQTLIPPIAKTIKTFALYPQFKDEIDIILNPTAVYAEKEKAGWNLTNGWKLEKTPHTSKRNILSERKTKKLLKEKNTDLLSPSLPILYNDDINVALFADALRERVIAWNWGLKNSYFLFGLNREAHTPLIINSEQIKKIKTSSDNEHTEFTCYSTPDNLNVTRITDTIHSMYSRGKNKLQNLQQSTIDPKTGKKQTLNNSLILFGLPYNMREKKDIRTFLSIIWSLERNKMKETTTTIKTTDNPNKIPTVEEIEDIGKANNTHIPHSVMNMVESDIVEDNPQKTIMKTNTHTLCADL